uniref:Uncharacterized protein n=1 Tax=viral metagenome TaxID=1070528 RepID=A0A6M3LUG5_9ZZZZ
MTRKRSNKLDKPVHEIAEVFAARFIAQYGIKAAEQIAKLAYEKVVASRKSLERRHGKK